MYKQTNTYFVKIKSIFIFTILQVVLINEKKSRKKYFDSFYQKYFYAKITSISFACII